jgi:hypothetical protein
MFDRPVPSAGMCIFAPCPFSVEGSADTGTRVRRLAGGWSLHDTAPCAR